MRLLTSVLLLVSALTQAQAYTPPPTAAPKPFQYPADTFAFKNETVWNYVGGEILPDTRTDSDKGYTRRCFVLSRASVQFWKFARFDPAAPPVPTAQLAQRIRQVCARSVWLPALDPQHRIVIPGYKNLRQASLHHPGTFQDNIGLGWPFYFRPGNIVITGWVTRALEDRLHREIDHDLSLNTPTIIWAYRFPSLKMNHVVVVYAATHDPQTGHTHYQVYDTNYQDHPEQLDYNPKTKTFTYPPTYYFKGGPVTVRALYRGLLQ